MKIPTLRKHIVEKKLALHKGTLSDLDYPPNYFDCIYGRSIQFFGADPQRELRLLFQYLKPGGRLLMLVQPRMAGKENVQLVALRTCILLKEAGFTAVQNDIRSMKPVSFVSISGTKARVHYDLCVHA